MTFPTLLQMALLPFAFLWLGLCVRYDLRNREVPMCLTVIPLVMAVMIGILYGCWLSACLVIVLILLSDRVSCRTELGLLGLLGIVILEPQSCWLNLPIYFVWLLWERGLLGGADAKILIALLLVWGSAWLLVWVAFAGGFQGLLAWWRKQREIPYTVAILLGSVGFWLATIL